MMAASSVLLIVEESNFDNTGHMEYLSSVFTLILAARTLSSVFTLDLATTS